MIRRLVLGLPVEMPACKDFRTLTRPPSLALALGSVFGRPGTRTSPFGLGPAPTPDALKASYTVFLGIPR
jgi:hypothetical protein